MASPTRRPDNCRHWHPGHRCSDGPFGRLPVQPNPTRALCCGNCASCLRTLPDRSRRRFAFAKDTTRSRGCHHRCRNHYAIRWRRAYTRNSRLVVRAGNHIHARLGSYCIDFWSLHHLCDRSSAPGRLTSRWRATLLLRRYAPPPGRLTANVRRHTISATLAGIFLVKEATACTRQLQASWPALATPH